jgi:hypothetical protein
LVAPAAANQTFEAFCDIAFLLFSSNVVGLSNQ